MAQPNATANGDASESACARRAKLRQLLTGFNPARTIVTRKPSAARADKSAVTGPWTTEYGPCIAGKKKIVSTQRRVTMVETTRLRSILPEYIHSIICSRSTLEPIAFARTNITNVTQNRDAALQIIIAESCVGWIRRAEQSVRAMKVKSTLSTSLQFASDLSRAIEIVYANALVWPANRFHP
jgi:hypothetical protein